MRSLGMSYPMFRSMVLLLVAASPLPAWGGSAPISPISTLVRSLGLVSPGICASQLQEFDAVRGVVRGGVELPVSSSVVLQPVRKGECPRLAEGLELEGALEGFTLERAGPFWKTYLAVMRDVSTGTTRDVRVRLSFGKLRQEAPLR